MENPSGEGSCHSEELKPSCPQRKEHMDSDDGKTVHESISPFHSDENSDILVTKSFSEGNVVVQPEPKKEEDKDDFQEPKVRHKIRMRSKSSKRYIGVNSKVDSSSESGIVGTVTCESPPLNL
ncbi:transcriptional regulator ATRX-like isoform 1-T1 [Sarcophilus harrisii]